LRQAILGSKDPVVLSRLWILACLLVISPAIVKANETSASAGIGPDDLGVIVNDADALSVATAEYYRKKRRIPDSNMIHVRFNPGRTTFTRAEYWEIKAVVDAVTPKNIQGYVLAWTTPYRVDCMSITTAFAAGFDEAFCALACGPTKASVYFNSSSRKPYDDHGWRPTMMLAGSSFKQVKKLIDRGVASDDTCPRGTGYLVSTMDKARNVRTAQYPGIMQRYSGGAFDLRLLKTDFIRRKKNVLFYFTGVSQVKGLETIRFRPGAIADHLTSAGGDLMAGGEQMSSLRWLEAGATASYGTVVEPCNYPDKFPHPGIVIGRYLNGETLLEAYWKSVAWPGQGVFIGEPLASPYRNCPKYHTLD
jgi:uncharacterized protein (TIGR03790 family)